ncbi:hypothetical protein Tco_1039109 [Tanacetum coccineum]
MCKEAALSKELRDLSFCSAVPIPRMTEEKSGNANVLCAKKKDILQGIILATKVVFIVSLKEKESFKQALIEGEYIVLVDEETMKRKRRHEEVGLIVLPNLDIKMTVKKAEPEIKNVPTTGISGDGTIIGMLKAKDDEIKQMIKDQAKEYYENIYKEKAWEQKLSEEKQKGKELRD